MWTDTHMNATGFQAISGTYMAGYATINQTLQHHSTGRQRLTHVFPLVRKTDSYWNSVVSFGTRFAVQCEVRGSVTTRGR